MRKQQDDTSAWFADGDLDLLIPEAEYSETYIPRMYGDRRDIDILDMARQKGRNVLMSGPTGPGKTSAVMAYCAEFGLPFYSIPCNQSIEPREIVGMWRPTPVAGVYEWQDGIVTTMAREMRGVVLLDEVNFLPRQITSYFHPLLDKRRMITLMDNGGEVIRTGGDFQVIAAYNPDYEGTKPLNEAFKNRFAVKLNYEYDRAIEEQLVSLPSLIDLAFQLRQQHGTVLDTPVSTNMLMEFEDIAFDLGFDFAVENFLAAFGAEERHAVREVMSLREADLRSEWNTVISS